MSDTYLDNRLQAVADLVSSKIATLEKEWEKPWVDIRNSYPSNLSGRYYSGSNEFILALLTEEKKYAAPVYMTFAQAKNEGLQVLKGSKSFPVFYRDAIITDKDKNKIKKEDYKLLSSEEKAACSVKSFLKCYDVFNIDQTNMRDAQPDKYAAIVKKHNRQLPEKGYRHELLSPMLEQQTWVCPIKTGGNRACYDLINDQIMMPSKDQFKSQEAFFGTLLHEMSHSTGHSNRLDRSMANINKKQLPREELVAELGSALAGMKLGVQKQISDENLTYIKAWKETAREDNRFIYKSIVDASKASGYICEHLGMKNELDQKVEQAQALSTGKVAHQGQSEVKKEFNIEQKLLDFNRKVALKRPLSNSNSNNRTGMCR
jgi:antirestriction protein ArdC